MWSFFMARLILTDSNSSEIKFCPSFEVFRFCISLKWSSISSVSDLKSSICWRIEFEIYIRFMRIFERNFIYFFLKISNYSSHKSAVLFLLFNFFDSSCISSLIRAIWAIKFFRFSCIFSITWFQQFYSTINFERSLTGIEISWIN